MITVLTFQQQQQKPVIAADEVTGVLCPSTFIIDVMFEPGRLLDTCSCEAAAYKTAYSWPSDS